MLLIILSFSRYQFDPNGKVREAMLSIWHAIVKDQRKVVDEYREEIVSELLANLHNPAWRVRQSCCVAVGNFLNGRSLDTLLAYLPQLWTMCLRDMDDIKESVRKAAEVACKTLQSVSIRVCDANQGKLGQEAIRVLLPVLLEQGLASRVDDVRKLVLHTIVKMSKNAGGLLKPHIPVLVVSLLESLSGLEPQQLNYLSFQLQKDPNMQEKLEDARISFSRSSPMMETVSLCVQHVDKTVLEELVPRLVELLRSGLGLGTKAGCASFVVSLVQQCGHDLQPYAGKLLSALLSGLTDRSQAVCKRYAGTIGSLVRVAKDSSVSKLFAKMKSWYFEKENESLQNACGLVCKEIARSSPDVMAHHATSILPVAFIAMHRKEKQVEVKSPWTDIWSENTPVSSRGIQLYLEEIIAISSTLLAGQSWERKVEAADSLQTVVKTLGKDLPKKHLESIVAALLSSLSGRTWDGKESIVSCIATVFVKCHGVMEDGANKEIALAVLKESRKQKPTYKANAIKRLGQILEEKKVIPFTEVYEVLKPILDPEKPNNEMKTEEEDEQTPDANLLINAFECLGYAWPLEREQQLEQREDVLKILTSSLKNHTWKIQLSILDSLNRYIGKVTTNEDEEFVSKITTSALTELFSCLGNLKYAAIRLKSLEVAKSVLSLMQTSKLEVKSEHQDLLRELYRILAILRNDNNENVKSQALQLDMFLKNLM
jgi:proteasome component ECM29